MMPLTIVKELPILKDRAIETAIQKFIGEVDVKGNIDGFFNATKEQILNSTYRRQSGDFWLAWTEDGDVLGYVLASLSRDIDDRLTYCISQAWANPIVRGTPWVKEAWARIRDQAKKYMCKHLMIVAGRNPKAYIRFLGKPWHEYATLLKEEL